MSKLEISSLYDRTFYGEIVPGALRSARAILPIVLARIPVRSAVDVGCGHGAWLYALEESGVTDLIGYDGDHVDPAALLIDPAKYKAVDLSADFVIDRTFDLAISLEVAEHLPGEFAAPLIRRLIAAAPVVLFSAAIPGQIGVHHVNEQWQEYWRLLFRSYGFYPVDLIRPQVWGNPDVEYWYQQNTILYCSDCALSQNSLLQTVPDNISLNIVHPDLYDIQLGNAKLYFRKALKMLPSLAWEAARRRIAR